MKLTKNIYIFGIVFYILIRLDPVFPFTYKRKENHTQFEQRNKIKIIRGQTYNATQSLILGIGHSSKIYLLGFIGVFLRDIGGLKLHKVIRLNREESYALVKKLYALQMYDKEQRAIGVFYLQFCKALKKSKIWSICEIGVMLTLIIVLFLMLLVNLLITKKILAVLCANLKSVKLPRKTQKNTIKPDKSTIYELFLLKEKFANLICEIQKEHEQLTAYTENVSHEINAPLAEIRSKLDLLQQSKNLKEEDFSRIGNIQQSLKKMSQLNEALLLLSKIENIKCMERKSLCIGIIIDRLLNEYSEMAQIQSIKIFKSIKYFKVFADPYLMEILIKNLIINAFRHNRYSGVVKVISQANELKITNSGPPLEFPPETYFQRFKKGNKNHNSSGLGLAIVKQICDISGFKVHYLVENNLHTVKVEF